MGFRVFCAPFLGLGEQLEGALLSLKTLAMLVRQIKEYLLSFVEFPIPTLFDNGIGEPQRLGVHREGARVASVKIAENWSNNTINARVTFGISVQWSHSPAEARSCTSPNRVRSSA